MPVGLMVTLWGTEGTHLPQALLRHGTEAQDLTDDGHPLQDIVGRCGGKGVSSDVCVNKCANVQAPPRLTGQPGQQSCHLLGLAGAGAQLDQRVHVLVDQFLQWTGGSRHWEHCLGAFAPASPLLASPRGRQGAGMVPRVGLAALALQHAVLAP